MYKHILPAALALATVTGCASKLENPTDYLTYRNEPLVKQVEDGMDRQQVLTLGGPPSSDMRRGVPPGTCHNYVLNKEGHQQPYYVSFDANDRVDGKGFMTCEQHERNEAEAAKR